MPCYEPRVYMSLSEIDIENKLKIDRLCDKVDKLTDLLCSAGRARKNQSSPPIEVQRWWDDHCKSDAERGEIW